MSGVAAGHDVGDVGDDADGHGHGVDSHGHAAVDDIIVPEARRPTTFHVNHFKYFLFIPF